MVNKGFLIWMDQLWDIAAAPYRTPNYCSTSVAREEVSSEILNDIEDFLEQILCAKHIHGSQSTSSLEHTRAVADYSYIKGG